MSCSCRAVIHPTWGAPSTEAFTAAEIPPADFLSPPQIISPVAGSHANCITIIDWADEPEDYTVPEERSQSFVFAYVIHRLLYLILYRSILSFELPMGLILSQQRIVSVYYLVHLGSSMWFMLGGQQTIDDPLSIFLNWSYNLPTIISFGSIHSFATISLDFCMHPLGLTKSNYFLLLCMSDIVHNRTEHVEKKRRPLRANIMSCRRCSMVGEVPPLSCISRLYSWGR